MSKPLYPGSLTKAFQKELSKTEKASGADVLGALWSLLGLSDYHEVMNGTVQGTPSELKYFPEQAFISFKPSAKKKLDALFQQISKDPDHKPLVLQHDYGDECYTLVVSWQTRDVGGPGLFTTRPCAVFERVERQLETFFKP